MRFAKAHGLGNDFLLVRAEDAPQEASSWARRLCDRHLGIGADGVLLYAPEAGGLHMRLLNADGSEAEISGNGVRCLAAFAAARELAAWSHVIRTAAGTRAVEVKALGRSRYRVITDLGAPRLQAGLIPVALDPARASVIDEPLRVGDRELRITATSLGNPHCAVFLDAPPDDATVETLGPVLERHALFPQRTNVEFITVVSASELRVRLWERGVGPTRSSGTGAASAAVAAILKGLCGRRVRVRCDGGDLEVEWPDGGRVRQTGEVEVLFEGDWALPV